MQSFRRMKNVERNTTHLAYKTLLSIKKVSSKTSWGQTMSFSELTDISNFSWRCQLSYEVLFVELGWELKHPETTISQWALLDTPRFLNWPKSPQRLGLIVGSGSKTIMLTQIGNCNAVLFRRMRRGAPLTWHTKPSYRSKKPTCMCWSTHVHRCLCVLLCHWFCIQAGYTMFAKVILQVFVFPRTNQW